MPDLLLFLALAAFLPLYTVAEMRWVHRRLRAGDPNARLWLYRSTFVVEWGLTLGVLALWVVAERSWPALGVAGPTAASLPGFGDVAPWRWWLALGLAVAGTIVLVVQAVAIVRSPEQREQARESLGALGDVLPRRREESRLFDLVAVTAGITEEVLYRGFLLWLLVPRLGVVGGTAVAVLLFGLAHAYQGLAGIAKTTAAGGLLMSLYLLGGALWAPILLHAAIDLTSGRLAAVVLRPDDEATGAADASAT